MFIGKSFAVVMFPLSILIILEQMNIFNMNIIIDKIMLGAILMIVLQLITLIMLHIHHNKPTIMNIITATVFICVALLAIINNFMNLAPKEVYIVLAVMMFVEALYALH